MSIDEVIGRNALVELLDFCPAVEVHELSLYHIRVFDGDKEAVMEPFSNADDPNFKEHPNCRHAL